MKYICENCIKNVVLLGKVTESNLDGECSYCDSTNVKVVDSDSLIQFAGDRLVKSLYSIDNASDYEKAMFFECKSDEIPFTEIAYIIEDLDIGDEAFEGELANYVYDNSDTSDDLFILNYGEHGNNSYKSKWSDFVKTTAHKHRFFNKNAKTFLDDLFDTVLDNGSIREGVVTSIDISTELFRARIANDENIRKKIVTNPASELGPVPEWLAGEQRMTPAGISSLYCALERETCFSEVRAITGDIVISGIFKPTQKMQFLDLTKIHNLSQLTVDPFHENFLDFSHKSLFIRGLMLSISKPASRNSSSSYLSTQVIFEYLSIKFGEFFSGLIFNSVQTDSIGTNVVFFPEYSKVIPSEKCFTEVKSINESYTDFADFQYYFYSIKKHDEDAFFEHQPKANLKFVDGSLVLSKVKAVVTKTENIDIEVSVS